MRDTDKPHPLSCSTMLRPAALRRLLSCTLLLVCLSGPGASRPGRAHGGAPDGAGAGSREAPPPEAVKTGILGSLGTDRGPGPARGATEQEARKMFRLYAEKLSGTRGNSSQLTSETRRYTTSTVLFPATVEPVKVPWRADHPASAPQMQWHRAVFHKNPYIMTEVTLARAELKISRPILNEPSQVQAATRQEVKVQVEGTKPRNSAAWTHVDVSVTRDATLDLSSEVEEWMRADGGQALVVDVGVAVADGDALEAKPTVSLELGLTHPRPAPRSRRSNKEDDCDERGWCCRKSLAVSFKDIGWTDWVVAPEEYTMHFCDGTCPHNYKPASVHTQVKSRLHLITKGATPRPCCVPAAYEPMVLMHYDGRGKLKVTAFDDFIVSKCHCA